MKPTISAITKVVLFSILINWFVYDYSLLYAADQKAKAPSRQQVELIVKYKDQTKTQQVKTRVASKLKLGKLESRQKLRGSRIEVLDVGSAERLGAVIAELKKDPNVAYVQPNYELTVTGVPSDARFSEAWGLHNSGQSIAVQQGTAGMDINATEVWKVTLGSASVIVGVLDSGIDIHHPDLAGRIYVNPGEIPDNGIDDDGNGYIDDVHGWDFANNDKSIFDSAAADKHGTHTAGIIASEANQIGARGVAPGVTLLPLKFISGQTGYTSDAIEAIEYAKQAGVKIINASFGSVNANPALEEAIQESGILFIAGAGNNGQDSVKHPIYPAAYALPNVVSVAATDNQGMLSSVSNYGANVDLAAPGTAIISTVPGDDYGYLSGTSMAAAMVSGTSALVLSLFPDMTAEQLAQRLLSAVKPVAGLKGKVRAAGVIDAGLAVQAVESAAADQVEIPSAASGDFEQEEMLVTLAAEIDPALQEQIHYGEEGVSVTTGNYSKSVTDMSVFSPGFIVNISRTYNSKDDRTSSTMGRGWTFGFEGNLKVNPSMSSQMIARLPNGAVQVFVGSGNYYTANDSHSTLVKQADNSHILTTTDQYSYGFNPAGYLVWMKDPNGNMIIIQVDNSGKVLKITDSVGRQFIVTYTGNYINRITDPIGRAIHYAYDTKNRLASVTDSSGTIVTRYEYNSSNYLIKVIDANEHAVETIVYNHASSAGANQHKVTKYSDSYGNTQNFTYDTTNRKTTIVDLNGRTLVKWYDTAMYVVKSQDPEGKLTTVEYYTDGTGFNKYGEEKSITDRNGNKTEYVRDNNGNITKITNPDSSFREYAYDSLNNLVQEKDELGNVIYYEYEPYSNRLLKTIQPLNGTDAYNGNDDSGSFAVTRHSYYSLSEAQRFGASVNGLLKSTTDPEGNTITYKYDKHGNVASITDPEGNITTKSYNLIGWLTAVVSPESFRTDYDYDKNGRVIRTTLDDGQTTRSVYDEMGRIILEIEPNQYVAGDDALNDSAAGVEYRGTEAGRRTEYYLFGKPKKVTDALGYVTQYSYDIYGNLTSEIRSNGSEYAYQYDAMNRVKQVSLKSDPGAVPVALKQYTYITLTNGQHQQKETVYLNDTEEAVTVWTYDSCNREIQKQNPDGHSVYTIYNTNGTVRAVTDARGNTTTYLYDGLNRVIGEWSPLDGSNFAYAGIEYDRAGRKLAEIAGKDPVKLFAKPVVDRTIRTEYHYDYNGQMIKITNPEGGETRFHYDGEGNVVRKEVYTAPDDANATEYRYNQRGQITAERQHVYNGELAGAKSTQKGMAILENRYVYDANGNLKSVTTPDGYQTIYTYDALNRQTEVKKPALDEWGQPQVQTISTAYDWEGRPLTVKDALNNITTYEYDERGLPRQKINADGGIHYFVYDRTGRKIAEVSPQNFDSGKHWTKLSRTEYTYDSMNRAKLVTEKFAGKQVHSQTLEWQPIWNEQVVKAYQYDENGNLIKELDAEGYAAGAGKTVDERIQSGYGTTTRYNAANLPALVLDPVSRERGLKYTTIYTYDGLKRKIAETDANGVIHRTYYNGNGDVISTTVSKSAISPEQTTLVNTYNDARQLVKQTDANGNSTLYTYNAFGQVRTTTEDGDETMPSYVIHRQYDAMGRLAKEWDELGKTNLWSYDPAGRVIRQTEQHNSGTHSITTTNTYDLNGNKRFATDGNGNQTEYRYDSLNRMIQSVNKVTDSAEGVKERTTAYIYDRNGNLLSERSSLGHNNSFIYDAKNRLIEKLDANDVTIQMLEYNANDVQIRSRDALKRLTSYRYDRNNRQISSTDPLNHSTATEYDAVGLMSKYRDGRGNETRYEYDYLGRLSAVVNALGERTKYTYDLNGNKLTQTDGNGHMTIFEYNAANLLKRRFDHDGRKKEGSEFVYETGKVESYTYYANGTMRSKLDRNSNTTTYIYDVHERLLSQKVEGEGLTGEALANRQISYTYDNNGNQLTITDGTGVTARTYDELDRVVTKSVPKLGTSVFRYDVTDGLPQGHTAEISKDVKGNVTTKVYDNTRRMVEVRSNSEQPIVYAYYTDGSRKSVEYPGGIKEEYTYTANNQLQQLKNWKGTMLLDTYTYVYDAAGNQTSKSEVINGVNKGTTSYTYDALNRLAKVQEPGGKTTAYSYDAAGNRVQEKVTAGSAATLTAYEYNEQNRLLAVREVKSTGESQVDQYRYDGNGNLIHKSREVTKLSDPYTQVEATFGMFIVGQENENPRIDNLVAGMATYEYDFWNQLIKTSTSGGTATYAYNGEGYRTKKTSNGMTTHYLYEYDKVVLETDESGNQKARNVYGLNLLTRQSGAETYSYLYNGHGDVTALVDTAGTIQASYYYDAFGNITQSAGTADNPIRYAGYQYDEETSLYYLNARYYDPKIARFLSEDTYRGAANDPLSLNLYTYSFNEPIMYVDPTGHERVHLTDLVKATGGSVSWNNSTKTATVIVNGKTVSFNTNDKSSGASLVNNKVVIDNQLFNSVFTSSMKQIDTVVHGGTVTSKSTNSTTSTTSVKNTYTGPTTSINATVKKETNQLDKSVKPQVNTLFKETDFNLKADVQQIITYYDDIYLFALVALDEGIINIGEYEALAKVIQSDVDNIRKGDKVTSEILKKNNMAAAFGEFLFDMTPYVGAILGSPGVAHAASLSGEAVTKISTNLSTITTALDLKDKKYGAKYKVYELVDSKGNVKYVGRTRQDLTKREQQHHKDMSKKGLDARVVFLEGKYLNGLNYSQARGLEQIVFDERTKQYGKLLNKIKPIDMEGKNYNKAQEYIKRGLKFIGKII